MVETMIGYGAALTGEEVEILVEHLEEVY